MCLMKFNPIIEYVPGKNLVVPDTLSRHMQSNMDDNGLHEDVQAYVDAVKEQERHKPLLVRIKVAKMTPFSLLDSTS